MIDPVQECFTALSNTVTRLARSVTQRQKAISRAVASHVWDEQGKIRLGVTPSLSAVAVIVRSA